MLYSMKSLNLAKFQNEFLMLTMFHASEFKLKIDLMPIDESVKQSMITQVDDFLAKLLEVSNFDPSSVSNSDEFTSEVRLARDTVLAFQH